MAAKRRAPTRCELDEPSSGPSGRPRAVRQTMHEPFETSRVLPVVIVEPRDHIFACRVQQHWPPRQFCAFRAFEWYASLPIQRQCERYVEPSAVSSAVNTAPLSHQLGASANAYGGGEVERTAAPHRTRQPMPSL